MIKTFEDIRQAKMRGEEIVDGHNDQVGWDEISSRPCWFSEEERRSYTWDDNESSACSQSWLKGMTVVMPASALKSECVPDPLPLPTKNLRNGGSQYRKDRPMFTGFVLYFPDAIAEASLLSKRGNDKHAPGKPLHWVFGASADHLDCQLRHMVDHDELDAETEVLEAAANFWRAGANLQTLLEKRDPELHALRQAQRDRQAKGER